MPHALQAGAVGEVIAEAAVEVAAKSRRDVPLCPVTKKGVWITRRLCIIRIEVIKQYGSLSRASSTPSLLAVLAHPTVISA
jgi:hypothetical protein